MENKSMEDGSKQNDTAGKLHIFSTSFNMEETMVHKTDDSHEVEIKRKRKRRIKTVDSLILKRASAKVGTLPPIRSPGQGLLTPHSVLPSVRSQPDDKSDEATTKYPETDDTVQLTKSATQSEPLLVFKLVTRFPVISFLLMLSVHLVTIVITGVLFATGQDVFPLVFDELPLLLFNDARLYQLSWKSKTTFEDFLYRPVYGVTYPTWRRGFVKDTVEVIFEDAYGGNLLTYDNLKRIQRAEDDLFNIPQYKDVFCTIDYFDNCIKPSSILRLFDGTYADVDPLFQNSDFANISAVVFKASQENETKEFLDLFLGRNAVITEEECFTSITRTFLPLGWPLGWQSELKRYGNLEDLKEFLQNVMKPAIENIRDNDLVDRINVVYISWVMFEEDLIKQALSDLQLAIGSFLFIFLFMCFQMASLTISFLGIFSILSSFLLTNLFYRYVFSYVYFGFFHVIAIFLILGIGADDLFVFYDTWRLTGHNQYPSDAHRLSDCYKRAAKTTLVTSLTTMTAFLVSGLSPLLPVQTFGIFAGVLVGINYLQVITFFPAVIILHHTKIKGSWQKVHGFLLRLWVAGRSVSAVHDKGNVSSEVPSTPRSNSSAAVLITSDENKNKLKFESENNSTTQENNSTTFEAARRNRKKKKKHGRHRRVSQGEKIESGGGLTQQTHDPEKMVIAKPAGSKKKRKRSHSSEKSFQHLEQMSHQDRPKSPCSFAAVEEEDVENANLCCGHKKSKKAFEDRNKVVLFLKNGFFNFITKRTVKIMIPLLFLAVSIFFIHRATLLEPDSSQIKLFRDEHNYAMASWKHTNSFRRNHDDDYTRLYLVWGMDKADISGCNLKSAEYCAGSPVWDDRFRISSVEEQQAVKDMCFRLENLSPAEAEKLRIRRDPITGKLEIACFITDMERYYQDMQQSMPGLSLAFPVDVANVTAFMELNGWIYRNGLTDGFDRYFEILISYWLTSGYTFRETKDYYMYTNLLAEQYVEGQTKDAYYTYSGMYYATKLHYMAVEVNTTMDLYSLGYTEGLPVYWAWEELKDNINSRMPPALQGGFQVTHNLWHWLFVQETLSDSAKTGIVVGLLTAWPILILTTLNYIIGTLAAVIISLVTCCVIGIIPLAGWKLGVLESINLCMVVGLSVDYVVHLAEAYRMSKSARRLDRVQDMLESIGLSVLSGAITTMGSATFMLFAQIKFFYQFGIFILSTVGIALLFSLLGFTTFMSLCGPQGDTGSLRHLFRKLVSCFSGKSKSEKDSECFPCGLMDRFYDWLSYKSDILASKDGTN